MLGNGDGGAMEMATQVYGYANQILEINLTSKEIGTIKTENLPVDEYLGGRGLGSYLLYKLNKPRVNPLSPENHLIIMTGPYTGLSTPFSAYFSVITKSPLTGTILSSHSGGSWGVYLKKAGYAGIIINGASKDPTMLVIDENNVFLEDASDYWGLDVYKVATLLQKKHPGSKVMTIGPAGENLVAFASIMNDRDRTAARGGPGAVMGSKKLKAIVVRGKKRIPVPDVNRTRILVSESVKISKEKTARFRYYGTPAAMMATQALNALPSYYYHETKFDGYESIEPDKWRSQYVVNNKACSACTIACSHVSRVEDERTGEIVDVEGPEYETFYAFGPQVGVKDIPSIIKSNSLCNKYGLDTISTGNVIAFAMDLATRGILDEKEYSESKELKFGNIHVILDLIRAITYRNTKLGNLLANGVKKASEVLGDEARKLAVHVKGLDFPAYDPRASTGMALAYATSPRGGCHLRATMYVPELFQQSLDRFSYDEHKIDVLIEMQNLFAVLDSMAICKFGARNVYNNDPEEIARLINLVTGWNLNGDDVLLIGERIWTIERLYNVREGFSKDDDVLPERFFNEPGSNDIPPLNKVFFNKALSIYYAKREWNEDGNPKQTLLDRLNMKALTL